MEEEFNIETIQDFDLIDRNEERYCKEGQDRCLICNAPMDVTDKTKYVHLLTSGLLTELDEHPESQGAFPVGNSCIKKIPKKFINLLNMCIL